MDVSELHKIIPTFIDRSEIRNILAPNLTVNT